jgi:hypothetical protein
MDNFCGEPWASTMIKILKRFVALFDLLRDSVNVNNCCLQTLVFLLLCPTGHNYLWVGKVFDFQTIDGTPLDTSTSIRQWASQVDRGDVQQNCFVGQNGLSDSLEIIM